MALIRKTFSWLAFIPILATAILPLVVVPGMDFPFIDGKALWFRLCVLAALILGFPIFRLRSWRPLLLLLPLPFLFVSDIMAYDAGSALLGNAERCDGFIQAATISIFGILLTGIADDRKWRILLWAMLTVSIPTGTLAAATVSYGARAMGTLGNSSYLGGYAVLMVFIGTILYTTSGAMGRIIIAAAFALNIYVIYLSGTRGAALALLAGCWTIAYFTETDFGPPSRAYRLTLWGLAACGVLSLSAGLLFTTGNTAVAGLFPRMLHMGIGDGEGRQRMDALRAAWIAITEHPLLGLGQEGFKGFYYSVFHVRTVFDRVHNIILDHLVDGGVPYTAAWLLAWAVALHSALRLPNKEKAATLGFVTAYFVHTSFVFDTITSAVPVYAVMGWLLGRNPMQHAGRILEAEATRRVGHRAAA